MIKIIKLSKMYGHKTITKALEQIDLEFPNKGLFFIIGKSGCGKTTLLNLIGGLDKPSEGDILFNNLNISQIKEVDLDEYRNKHIGFIFQDYNLLENYNVGENISLPLELQGVNPSKKFINKTLMQLDLCDSNGNTFFNKKINELSGGQKQRVAIARALIKNPSIILADEPTGALDSESGKAIFEILKSISKERLVIVVTHDKERAEQYANRIIELKDGKIIADKIKNDYLNDIEEETDYSNLKSKSFVFSRKIKMGVNGLKHKAFRLITSIILAIISFTFFSISLVASTSDIITTELKTLYENNIHTIFIEPDSSFIFPFDNSNAVYPNFSLKQLDLVTKFNNNNLISIEENIQTDFSNFINVDYNEVIEDDYYSKMMKRVGTWKAFVSKDASIESIGLTKDTRFIDQSICHLPENEQEIAITDLNASAFIKYGYRSLDGIVTKIDTPDDLIGKQLGEYIISGVYSTQEDSGKIKDVADHYNEDYKFYYRQNLQHLYYFVFLYQNDSSLDKISKSSKIMVNLTGDLNKDKEFIKSLTLEDKRTVDYYGKIYETKINASCKISSSYHVFVENAQQFMGREVKMVMTIACIAFTIISTFLTLNFMLVGVEFRKKEYGILRAMGAKKRDVLSIQLSESILIAIIDTILTTILTLIICLLLNNYFYVSLFNFGFIPILLLIALSFGTTIISSILPMIMLMKQNPIDVINNK